MTWLEWFQSLASWQVWGILIGVGFVWMKLAEWNVERRAIEQAKVNARTTRKKAAPKSKKKPMPPIKALGNSIVPQVVYEIFKAIEQIEI